MKKGLKAISVLLAALTLSSTLAASASAAGIFIGNISSSCKSDDCKDDDDTSNLYIPIGGGTSSKKNVFKTVTVLEPASYKGDKNNPTTVYVGKEIELKYPYVNKLGTGKLYGYKYYSKKDAKKCLEDYFSANTYTIQLNKGQVREFNSDLYYFSEDPDVAYFDYDNDAVVAVSRGSTYIYVYTKGGVPVYRLKINVVNSYKNYDPVRLVLDAEDWNISVGEKMTISVTASDGKTYDDIRFKIMGDGYKKASLTQITGEFKAEKNGAVIVRAYRESDPNVYGDILVYIGSYTNAIIDGYYTTEKDCISVNKWFNGSFTSSDYYVVIGWVKNDDGTIIPIISNNPGKIVTTKSGTVSYIELLRNAYGDKRGICDILEKYNKIKYGKDCEKAICDADDYRNFFFANTLEDLLAR